MDLLITGLDSLKCQPQYQDSPDLFCAWRIEGMDIIQSWSTVTITAWSAYVKVTDADGTEFLVKVYLENNTTLSVSGSQDIIIRVPQANVDASSNNGDLYNIATIEAVATGTWGSYHLVLATTNSAWISGQVNNAGHYLPWCDYCIKCENSVLQLPRSSIDWSLDIDDSLYVWEDVNIEWDLETGWDICSNWDIEVKAWWGFIWDWSQITNINASNLSYATTLANGVVRLASDTDFCLWNTIKPALPDQILQHVSNAMDFVLPWGETLLFDKTLNACNVWSLVPFWWVETITKRGVYSVYMDSRDNNGLTVYKFGVPILQIDGQNEALMWIPSAKWICIPWISTNPFNFTKFDISLDVWDLIAFAWNGTNACPTSASTWWRVQFRYTELPDYECL